MTLTINNCLTDNTGGGLALLFMQRVINHNLPIPALVVVMSPWTDLASTGASYKHNAEIDIMLKVSRIEFGIQQCFGGRELMLENNIDVRSPEYSPIYGSFNSFPPTLILVGTGEVLHSEGVQTYEQCKSSGVQAELYQGEHLCHVFPLFFKFAPEAELGLQKIVSFVKSHMD